MRARLAAACVVFLGGFLLVLVPMERMILAQAPGGGGAAPAGIVQVDITDAGFEPAELAISVGDTVIWRNTTALSYTLLLSDTHDLFLPLIQAAGNSHARAHSQQNGRAEQIRPAQPGVLVARIPPGGAFSHIFKAVGGFDFALAEFPRLHGRVRVEQSLVPSRPTLVPTSTRTPTPTSTPTATATPTHTPTMTATPTRTPTVTPTPTIEPTFTPHPTRMPRPTRTAAPTEIATPMDTPADTPASTPIGTPTSTPTDRPTETGTPTETPASMPTDTLNSTHELKVGAGNTFYPPASSVTMR